MPHRERACRRREPSSQRWRWLELPRSEELAYDDRMSPAEQPCSTDAGVRANATTTNRAAGPPQRDAAQDFVVPRRITIIARFRLPRHSSRRVDTAGFCRFRPWPVISTGAWARHDRDAVEPDDDTDANECLRPCSRFPRVCFLRRRGVARFPPTLLLSRVPWVAAAYRKPLPVVLTCVFERDF
jgi:hypothetical protein